MFIVSTPPKNPAPAGRNVPEVLVRAPHRNGAPTISPRWGLGLCSTFSYKHCVPLGLTLAAYLFMCGSKTDSPHEVLLL